MSDWTNNPYAPPSFDELPIDSNSGSPGIDGHVYHSAEGLATALRWLIGAAIVVTGVSMVTTGLEIELLGRMNRDGAWSMAEAESNDSRAMLIAGLYLLSILGAGIVWFVWQNRVSKNSRALGAEGMEFGPNAWGWFFCPIYNLWRPLQVLRELWQANEPKGDLSDTPTPEWMKVWWGAWIITGILSRVSAQLASKSADIDQLITSDWLDLVASVTTVIAGVFAIKLVAGIQSRQRARAARLNQG